MAVNLDTDDVGRLALAARLAQLGVTASRLAAMVDRLPRSDSNETLLLAFASGAGMILESLKLMEESLVAMASPPDQPPAYVSTTRPSNN